VSERENKVNCQMEKEKREFFGGRLLTQIETIFQLSARGSKLNVY
jgi:hypothetical protein